MREKPDDVSLTRGPFVCLVVREVTHFHLGWAAPVCVGAREGGDDWWFVLRPKSGLKKWTASSQHTL